MVNSKQKGIHKCFISHCSEDVGFVNDLDAILRRHFDKKDYSFFYTSGTANGTHYGQQLSRAIRTALKTSDLMIAVITDSYMRSLVSIAELSTFWYLEKPVIPIVFAPDGAKFLEDLFGVRIIYVDLSRKEQQHIGKCADDMLSSMNRYNYIPSDAMLARDDFFQLFLDGQQAGPYPPRPYIGSGETFEKILQYCEQYGISLFKNTSKSTSEMCANLEGAKEIYIVATTGANLIRTLSAQFIPKVLRQGTNLTVLIPNRNSSYVSDVAEIESPGHVDDRKTDFAREFDGVVSSLKQCLTTARNEPSEEWGEIYLGCAYNLIRQTITLGVWEDHVWGWLSITIPPKRTVDGTPSLEFSGNINDTVSIGKLLYDHVLAIRDIAERKRSLVKLSEAPDFHEFFLENERAEGYWKSLYEKAKNNTWSREQDEGMELIEVAAQHPLLDDGKPGKEFTLRLDRAVNLYKELSDAERKVKIYVPGSLHCHNGKADPCSLSESGTAYLVEAGIPRDDLLGEAENIKYKGEEGVYNTADECFVASQLFLDGNYRRLHCVCSPNQMLRKKLFYMAFGILPYYHLVNANNLAHDDIFELFHAFPEIIERDHTWQDEDSFQAKRTRAERNPRLNGLLP